MCLMLFSYDLHAEYRLVLLANRDEFYRRPTAPLNFWKDAPQVLAGRDLQAAGTWLGVTTGGRVAGVTNYRDPAVQIENGLSRGALVADFLREDIRPSDYFSRIERLDGRINGYNLIAGDCTTLRYHSNRGSGSAVLTPGVYGLSNHLLNTPWPKVKAGVEALGGLLEKPGRLDLEDFFDLLSDPAIYPDETLPDTGVGLFWERFLSSIFIAGPDYGTRSSAVILIGRKGSVTFAERTFGAHGVEGDGHSTRRYDFQLQS